MRGIRCIPYYHSMKINHLFVIESPNKQERIRSYVTGNPMLEGKCEVIATIGHILSLSKKYKVSSQPNNPDPEWEIDPKKRKQVATLRSMVGQANHVYLATDPDLAGEFIAWSVLHVCGIAESKYTRVVFHSITKESIYDAIHNGISNQTKLNRNKVHAEQTRIILDQLIGFGISPMIIKTTSGRSAGRCQSPITKLVQERETKHSNFRPLSSFRVQGTFSLIDSDVDCVIESCGKGVYSSEQDARTYLESFPKSDRYMVQSVTSSTHHQQPPLPYKTSTALSDLTSKTGMSVKKITSSLQSLFSMGLITYIRTKSSKVDRNAISKITKQIETVFGSGEIHSTRPNDLVMSAASLSKRKGKREQESHECIRVTNPCNNGNGVTQKSLKTVYTHIWKRTIASFMKPHIYETYHATLVPITVMERDDIPNDNHVFQVDVNHTLHQGFQKVYASSSSSSSISPFVTKLQSMMSSSSNKIDLKALRIQCLESVSKYPSLFTESSLITTMESINIGTEATYASIVSKILERGYVTISSDTGVPGTLTELNLSPSTGHIGVSHKEVYHGSYQNRLVSTPLGRKVSGLLDTHVPDIMRYEYTSDLEKHIIEVEKGERGWGEVVSECYQKLHPSIQLWTTSHSSGKEKRTVTTETYGDVCVYEGKYSPVIQLGESKSSFKYIPIPGPYTWDTVTGQEVEMLIQTHHQKEEKQSFQDMVYQGEEYTVTVKPGIKTYGPYLSLVSSHPNPKSKSKSKPKSKNVSLKKWMSKNMGKNGVTMESLETLDRNTIQTILDEENDRIVGLPLFDDYKGYSVIVKDGKGKRKPYIQLTHKTTTTTTTTKKQKKPTFIPLTLPPGVSYTMVGQECVSEHISSYFLTM